MSFKEWLNEYNSTDAVKSINQGIKSFTKEVKDVFTVKQKGDVLIIKDTSAPGTFSEEESLYNTISELLNDYLGKTVNKASFKFIDKIIKGMKKDDTEVTVDLGEYKKIMKV